MKEILFRGQTRRKGEKVKMNSGELVDSNWVFGGVFAPSLDGDFAVMYGNKGENNHKGIQGTDLEKFVVYRNTLGQFTGIFDKNNMKIFEGDIVKIDGGLIGEVYYSYDYRGYLLMILNDPCAMYDYDFNNKSEVIGNIYDNPELLQDNKITLL